MKRMVFAPQNYIGSGSISRIPDELTKHGASRVLLVTDPVLLTIGTAVRIGEIIQGAGCKMDIFSNITPEPSLSLAEEIVSFTRTGGFDYVVGLGGGSALDLAKLAAVLSVHDGKVADYLNLTGTKRVSSRGLPKILIPTTSGTGSEVTNISVLSLEKTKDVITHDFLLPDASFVDAELTLTVPPRVTAATGMDALTHAIEAYLSVQANHVTDALALHAVRLISSSLAHAANDGRDLDFREKMAQASHLAGLAFFNAGVAGVHALAYPLGGQFHLPHGEANAVLLPYVMDYIRPSCEEKIRDLLYYLGKLNTSSNMETSTWFVDWLHELISKVGLPSNLQEYGINEHDLELLASEAAQQTRLLARSPMKLEYEDIFSIYRAALYGKGRITF